MKDTRRLVAFALAVLAFALSPTSAAPAQQATRFTFVDVHVDSGAELLGAWQVRLVDPSGRASIVGVEGGEDEAWRDAPYYDPKALAGGVIAIAALHTGDGATTGDVRVARLHLEVKGAADVDFQVTLEAAASPRGNIDGATVRLVRG